MNSRIQNRLTNIKNWPPVAKALLCPRFVVNTDSLDKVIRSQKDADEFMAQLESVSKRAK